jgi:hypothetical protein
VIERHLILDLDEITNQTRHTRPPGQQSNHLRLMRLHYLMQGDSGRKPIAVTTVPLSVDKGGSRS